MEQAQVEGAWTIKDLLGHITAWEAIFLDPLESYAAGGEFRAFIVPDHDAWNAEQIARRRNWSLTDVLDEMAAVRDRLVAAALRLTPEQGARHHVQPWGPEETSVEALDGLAWHEEEHLKSIQRWRQAQT
jgi:uncharacterized damage-inducible protein DinB